MMNIKIINDRYIIIQTGNGQFHFDTEEYGKTKFSLYDHFELTIEGKAKNEPTITIDSDEFPTKLIINNSETPWVKEAVLL